MPIVDPHNVDITPIRALYERLKAHSQLDFDQGLFKPSQRTEDYLEFFRMECVQITHSVEDVCEVIYPINFADPFRNRNRLHLITRHELYSGRIWRKKGEFLCRPYAPTNPIPRPHHSSDCVRCLEVALCLT